VEREAQAATHCDRVDYCLLTEFKKTVIPPFLEEVAYRGGWVGGAARFTEQSALIV